MMVGATAPITSEAGSTTAAVRLTDEVGAGFGCLPDGFGPEADYNALTSEAAGWLKPLVGMSVLNGAPVRMEPLRRVRRA